MGDDKLHEYEKKRDLDRSPEPGASSSRKGAADRTFVIHKHDASSLHYDVRIAVDGALVSWAVPKGPSTDPRDKRLAIRTEDHPLDYGDFEGVIPEDEYGAGAVMVWDRGTYRNNKQPDDGDQPPSVASQIENGHATIWLEGEKIRGGYALTRTDKDKDHWLLVKMDDDEADARRNPTSTENHSVASGRTMREIEQEEAPDPPKSDG